jgi:hypothetical protein
MDGKPWPDWNEMTNEQRNEARRRWHRPENHRCDLRRSKPCDWYWDVVRSDVVRASLFEAINVYQDMVGAEIDPHHKHVINVEGPWGKCSLFLPSKAKLEAAVREIRATGDALRR